MPSALVARRLGDARIAESAYAGYRSRNEKIAPFDNVAREFQAAYGNLKRIDFDCRRNALSLRPSRANACHRFDSNDEARI
jgi:hypothetical protein